MITVAHWSEPGGHAENQDAFAVRGHPLDPEWYLCVMADGQGGQQGAAEAAQLACRTFLTEAGQQPPKRLLEPGTWTTILRRVDQTVEQDDQAGYTTLVALMVMPQVVVGASSGDSAALVLRADREAEILTARQRKNPPVGSGSAVFLPFTSPLIAPWTLLVVTDGVWKYAGWENLLKGDVRESPAATFARLRARATLPGSGGLQDDFTLVILQEE